MGRRGFSSEIIFQLAQEYTQAKACGYNSDIRDIVSGRGMMEYINNTLWTTAHV